jgi:hypothetical protein
MEQARGCVRQYVFSVGDDTYDTHGILTTPELPSPQASIILGLFEEDCAPMLVQSMKPQVNAT